MKFRPLIIGTLLASCFWIISLVWGVAGGQNGPAVPPGENENEVQVPRHDMLVTFDGALSKQGQLVIWLFNDADSFRLRQKPVDECYLKLDLSDDVIWEFGDVPEGEYALVAFHDANENWTHDDDENHSERIAFSAAEIAEGHFVTDPTFAQCKFFLNQNRVIQLRWQK